MLSEITRRSLRYHSHIDNVSLKQGTLLLDAYNFVYLCIQPLCDSVRLHEKADFYSSGEHWTIIITIC